MKRLAGRGVVITGAASGIGQALAKAFADRGARLLLADVQGERLQALLASLRSGGADANALTVDVADRAAIEALAQRARELWGGADVLVNNAGVAVAAPVETVAEADARWLMEINFWGVWHGCRAFLPQLRARPEAMIVNVSSIFAMVSMPTQSIYNASKAAVRAFSDALREELAGSSVGLLCVHPGGVSTAIARSARCGDLSMIADDRSAMVRQFDRAARTSPEAAAESICVAIEKGRQRLLIGTDARLFDLLWRLAPERAAGWLMAMSQRERARLQRP